MFIICFVAQATFEANLQLFHVLINVLSKSHLFSCTANMECLSRWARTVVAQQVLLIELQLYLYLYFYFYLYLWTVVKKYIVFVLVFVNSYRIAGSWLAPIIFAFIFLYLCVFWYLHLYLWTVLHSRLLPQVYLYLYLCLYLYLYLLLYFWLFWYLYL